MPWALENLTSCHADEQPWIYCQIIMTPAIESFAVTARHQSLTVRGLFLIVLLGLNTSHPAAAERAIYKWRAADGSVTFSERPPVIGEHFEVVGNIDRGSVGKTEPGESEDQVFFVNGAGLLLADAGDVVNLASAERNADGLYTVEGEMNGHALAFLVDTGATNVVLNRQMAKALGIELDPKHSSVAITASGRTRSYDVVIDSVRAGSIAKRRVRATVIDSDYPRVALLGMSFLNDLDISQHEGQLRLVQRFLEAD